MPRRPRVLSAGERSLWHTWAQRAGVTPRAGQVLPDPPPPPTPTPVPPAPLAAAPPPRRPAQPLPALLVGAPPPGMDARRWKDLRRGTTRPERTLDLHGRRAQEAHEAVLGFLRDAHADGVRCVAIVTGKGSREAQANGGEGGVLRRELPHWLNGPALRSLVLGAAHPHVRNSGAVHLLLRRRAAALRPRA
ncbi:Smr/MutS family protein [Roseomonas sp. BN140053]|uniref:Smr/MutS family protein n=1 Tax=Roseomonas sp. BN140053 TaxID=3391898 RepID=UPI0039E9D6CF